jgi:hypothetical protein
VFKRFLFFAFALAVSSATALAAPPMKGMGLPPQPKVRPAGLPKDVVMLSPCVATMGEHWANLKNMPTGPIYGTYQGKPVFTEIMVTVDQLKKGFSWADIRALPGYTIDHVDFEFEPHGHEGLPVPHYDVHAYYVTPAEEAKICPNGIPNPAMKPTNVKASH